MLYACATASLLHVHTVSVALLSCMSGVAYVEQAGSGGVIQA